MTHDLPVACALTDDARREREAEIRRLLADEAEAVVEREDGIEVRFDGSADCLPGIAELVALERECCRFLRFEVVAEPGKGPIRLLVTGPEGTRELLEGWLG